MDWMIRPALIEDCPGIARIQVDSFRSAYAGLFPETYLAQFRYEEQEQDWIELLTSNPEDILLTALSPEKQVIGYVLARAEPDIYPGYDAEIVAMHVNRACQQQGIGRELLRRAVEALCEQGCKSAMLWTLKNNRARQWYEKLGGSLLGEKSYDVDGWWITEVAYGWKNLSHLQ